MTAPAFLAFSLGPVQTFIGAARTVRDLWTGSFLLSWLTYHALETVADAAGPEAVVFPDIRDHPLWRRRHGERFDRATLLEPCLPNRFLAEVPADRAHSLAQMCQTACRDEWRRIAEAVRTYLAAEMSHPSLAASGLWQQQIESFFEIVAVVLPQQEYGRERLQALLGAVEDGREWTQRWQIAGKLLQAARSVRHFPDYAPPEFPGGKVPQKCSLLASYEHLGPGDRDQAREWWKKAANEWRRRGTRTGPRERLCAVSLVKRFAWPVYFHEKLGVPLHELRFEDTATTAATVWLETEPKLDPVGVREKYRDWSGQWLHWSQPNQDPEEEAIPDEILEAIRAKRRRQGKPPTYYAVLVMDADRMGDRLLQASGPDDHRRISRTLAKFALNRVRGIVEDQHRGQLIYAGGDDVLAVLPTENALACARDLEQAFAGNWLDSFGNDPARPRLTLSAGLVVAHYKEDLRFVLRQAHGAEKEAKNRGRNALYVRVCRRSGEHSGALCPWPFVPRVIAWEEAFRNRASDRWAYRLRQDLETLEELGDDAVAAELRRQVKRTEERTQKLLSWPEEPTQKRLPGPEAVADAFRAYRPQPLADFVTLVQTASFLARGKDA